MRFEFFVSRRYLASRERRGIISLITVISIGGVAVGVAALIVVIAVMDGFDKELMERIMGSSSHLTIRRGWSDMPFTNYREIVAAAESDPDVLAASPLIARQALLQAEMGIEAAKVGIQIQGFDLDRESRVTSFMRDVKYGSAQPGERDIVLGLVLARRLNIHLGDPVYALTKLGQFATGPHPKIAKLRVSGVFQTGLYEVDANFAYVSLDTAQRIFLLDDVADQVHIRVKDPYRLEPVKRRLRAAIDDPSLLVLGWDEFNPEFFSALKLEKIVMFVILLLIVLVAAFNIIGTLVMIVIEKTREIGILRAMGTSHRQILAIFLLQGLIVGLVGIAVGMGVGFFICWSLNTWFPIQLPAGVYGISRMPVLVKWETVGIIVASALAICLAASLLPAWRASRLQPTTALRYE
ncbi:MAG: ABC transporter permease [Candidatus Sumerlaeia bacterium]|nr:ABC transporter permease [Candidatus Sumerlaeia bacterium]